MTSVEAVVFSKVDTTVIDRIEVGDPAAGEVQIRTVYSMVSTGTERWGLRNEFTWAPTPYPCVPGYQRTGIVEKLGAGVEGFQVGDRVMATGNPISGGVIHSFWGAHTALNNTAATEVYALPDEVGLADASGTVVAQVGYNAASRPQLAAGDWVVVFGDGLIGQCASQAARARGARTIVVGRRAQRLELALRYSADAVVNSREADVEQTILQLTGAEKVTAVIDTIQTEEAQQQYMPLFRADQPGQIVYSGFSPDKVWANMAHLQQRELTCYFVAGWTRQRMEATIALMADKRMVLEPLSTHISSYKQAPQLYDMLLANKEPFLGVIIDWRGADL